MGQSTQFTNNNSHQQAAVVTLSLYRFSAAKRWWAFRQMRKGQSLLQQLPGASFARMMGSGNGAGFSFWPNISVYAILIVWEDWEWLAAYRNKSYLASYGQRAQEQFTLLLAPTQVKGKWGGHQPFPLFTPSPINSLTAVLTRATIRKSQLINFWRHVPATSKAIEKAQGQLFSIGIGEWPWVQQATFSIWENEEAIRKFAYEQETHRHVIRKTREKNWYSEEMFARFRPIATIGSWNGNRLLEPYGISSFGEWPQPTELQAITND